MADESSWRKNQLVPNVVQNNSGVWRFITSLRQPMSRVCSPHKFLFVTSCVVYSRLGSGEDESFSSGRRQFSLACPAVLYQAGCSSLSRLRSEQCAISPCKAAELNCSEETKKKKRKREHFFFSGGTFFQLGIKSSVFVRLENTMMLQLDHWGLYLYLQTYLCIPHHMKKSWQNRSLDCVAVWQSEYKSDKNHFLARSQSYKKDP